MKNHVTMQKVCRTVPLMEVVRPPKKVSWPIIPRAAMTGSMTPSTQNPTLISRQSILQESVLFIIKIWVAIWIYYHLNIMLCKVGKLKKISLSRFVYTFIWDKNKNLEVVMLSSWDITKTISISEGFFLNTPNKQMRTLRWLTTLHATHLPTDP